MAPNAIASTSQSHGESRIAKGAGSGTGAVLARVDWSTTEFAEGPAESWRPTSFVASLGVADWPAPVRSLVTAGAALGEGALKLSELGGCSEVSPAPDEAGCDTAGAAPAVAADCARGKYAITAEARNKKIAAPLDLTAILVW